MKFQIYASKQRLPMEMEEGLWEKGKMAFWMVKKGTLGTMCFQSVAFPLPTVKKHQPVAIKVLSLLPQHNKGGLSRLMNDDLMAIFNSIIQNEAALVFMHRRSGQKRSRYKEMIKQHMDIETVRSRLVSCSIRSASELFRDLLLLATNSIIFYLKKTREYKAATALRDIITKTYHDHCKSSYHTATSSLFTFSTRGSLPMKPRSARPRPSKFKLQSESCNNVNSLAEILGLDDHKPCDVNSEAPLKSLLAAKKGFKGHRKFECGSVDGSVNQRIRVPGEEGKEDTRPKTPVMEDRWSEVVTDERKRARKGDLQVA